MSDLLRRLSHQPVWLLGILLLTPLSAILLDIARGDVLFTRRVVLVGYVLYAFRLLFLLVVQFGAILILFAVGPVWMFTIFLTVVDFIALRWMSVVQERSLPLLCTWCNVSSAACGPALLAYHLASAILAFVVFRYGGRVLDVLSGWHYRVVDRLAARMDTPTPITNGSEDEV
jgi:hypothetical protein